MTQAQGTYRPYPFSVEQREELRQMTEKARHWIKQNSMQYNPELGGKHTLINVETGEYVFAKQLEEARTLFKNKFGEKIKPFLFLG